MSSAGAESRAAGVRIPVVIQSQVPKAGELGNTTFSLKYGLETRKMTTYASHLNPTPLLPHGGNIDLQATKDKTYQEIEGINFTFQPDYPPAGPGPIFPEPPLGGMARRLASDQERVETVEPIEFGWVKGSYVEEIPNRMTIKIGRKSLTLSNFSKDVWVIEQATEVYQGEDEAMVGKVNEILAQIAGLAGFNLP